MVSVERVLPAAGWFGLGLGLGLLIPTLWEPASTGHVWFGWLLLLLGIVGLVFIPLTDYIRLRTSFLPNPPVREQPFKPKRYANQAEAEADSVDPDVLQYWPENVEDKSEAGS